MERFGCRKNYDHRGNVEEKVFSKKKHRINTLLILKNQIFVTQKCVKPIWAWYEKKPLFKINWHMLLLVIHIWKYLWKFASCVLYSYNTLILLGIAFMTFHETLLPIITYFKIKWWAWSKKQMSRNIYDPAVCPSNESGICCTSICLVQTKYLCFSFTISLSKLNTIPNATIGKLKYLCNPDDTQSIKQIVSITIIGLWCDIKSHSLGFVWTINHVDYALFSEAWGFFSPKKIPHIVTQGQ